MPNRIIRETIRTSPTLNSITAEAHRLWSHLITVADDEGRFLSDAGIVLANCFPLKIGIMRRGAVEKSLLELDRAGLIQLYYTEKRDRRYGQFVTWKTYNPRCRYGSKWPPPPAVQSVPLAQPTNGNHVESAPVAANGQLLADLGAPHTSSSYHRHLREKKNGTLSDVEWFDQLKKNPTYSHVDFEREDKEMDKWLARHPGRKKTRRFIENWLNKVEPPVKIQHTRKLFTKPKAFMRMQEAEAMMRTERREE